MRKLLIVPAILAMTCMSGSAFAQRSPRPPSLLMVAPTTALASPTICRSLPNRWIEWQPERAGLIP